MLLLLVNLMLNAKQVEVHLIYARRNSLELVRHFEVEYIVWVPGFESQLENSYKYKARPSI